jgi:hypothetical protein
MVQMLDVRQESQKSVDQARPQDVDFSYFDSCLQMSVLSSEIRITYLRIKLFYSALHKLTVSQGFGAIRYLVFLQGINRLVIILKQYPMVVFPQ